MTPVPQSLPVLPKPLSILKTAETRTYLSKLIWLGNGGKRPQYGNPETKVVTNELSRLELVFVKARFAIMLNKLLTDPVWQCSGGSSSNTFVID